MTYLLKTKYYKQKSVNNQISLKISYRDDYFFTLRNLPKYERIYKKIRYIIRSRGKH